MGRVPYQQFLYQLIWTDLY